MRFTIQETSGHSLSNKLKIEHDGYNFESREMERFLMMTQNQDYSVFM